MVQHKGGLKVTIIDDCQPNNLGESLQQCWWIGDDGVFFCNTSSWISSTSTFTRCLLLTFVFCMRILLQLKSKSVLPRAVLLQPMSQFKTKQFLLAGCAVQKEMRISGEKLLSKEGLDWAACAVACFHHPECNYWTHHLQSSDKQQMCELSSLDEQKIPAQSGSMTGQKACGKPFVRS